MATHLDRRSLSFADLDEVLDEVRRLAPAHRTTRRWTLAQICRHLADTINGSIDGFDLRRHRLKRRLFRRLLWRYTLRYGIPENYTVDPNLEPRRPADLHQEIERVVAAVVRYQAHDGSLQPHPLFGRLGRADWDRLHRLHCAHHLSFVFAPEPRRESPATPPNR